MSHHHPDLAEAGQCPECRANAIDLLSGGRHGFVLRFYLDTYDEEAPGLVLAGTCDHCGQPSWIDLDRPNAMAVVRSQTPDSPVEAAWATGCHPGDGFIAASDVPVAVLERAGVPLFSLIGQPGADAALDQLRAAAADD